MIQSLWTLLAGAESTKQEGRIGKYMREAPEAPVLTQERLRSLEGRDPIFFCTEKAPFVAGQA